MHEGQEEVAQYARILKSPSSKIEAALTGTEQGGPMKTSLDEEAL